MKDVPVWRFARWVTVAGIVFTSTTQFAFATDLYWNPRIVTVQPHKSQGETTNVAQADRVDIAVWPTSQVSCSHPPVTDTPFFAQLMVARDNEPTEPVGVAYSWTLLPTSGGSFPTMDYNEFPADLVASPNSKYHFVVYGPGPNLYGGFISNVWTYATDIRTYLPTPVIPTGIDPDRRDLEARIQIVWPHDAAGNFTSVDQAPFVNVAVDAFQHGTLNSLPPDQNWYGILLFAAKGNEPPERINVSPEAITYTVDGQTFPRFVFNDIPVQSGEPYTFIAELQTEGDKIFNQHASIWVHSADPRPRPMTLSPPLPCVS